MVKKSEFLSWYVFLAAPCILRRQHNTVIDISLTDVSKLSRLCDAVCGPFSADCAQSVTENGARVAAGGAQSVTEVTERGQNSITTVTERRQTAEQLGTSTSQ